MSDAVVAVNPAPVAAPPEPQGQPVPPTIPQPVTAPPLDTRQRDEHGRFVSAAPPEPPPPQPKFSAPLIDAARAAYYTDEQINSFTDASLLFDAVRGRYAAMQQQNSYQPPPGQHQTVSQQPAMQPAATNVPAPLVSDFNFQVPEDLDPETTKTMKSMVEHFNAVTKKLADEVTTVKAKNTKLEESLQQSAATQQQVAQQQYAQLWDSLASEVPGMVEAIGKPSQVVGRTGSQAAEWAKVALRIQMYAAEQNVPPEYIDYRQAVHKAWAGYQADKNATNGNNGSHKNGNAGLPGVAVRSSSRSPVPPVNKGELSPEDDYARRLAVMQNAFMANNGKNPLSDFA